MVPFRMSSALENLGSELVVIRVACRIPTFLLDEEETFLIGYICVLYMTPPELYQ